MNQVWIENNILNFHEIQELKNRDALLLAVKNTSAA